MDNSKLEEKTTTNNELQEEIEKIKENITNILKNEEMVVQQTEEIFNSADENVNLIDSATTESNVIENIGATSKIENTMENENVPKDVSYSLMYLNQYGSDSSSDGSSDDEKMDESSSDSDSSSDSSDSSSSSSESNNKSSDDLELIAEEIDEKSNSKTPKGPLRVKGEKFIDELPPIEKLCITVPEEQCVHIGSIKSIVNQLVLIESLPGLAPLDLDTILFLDKGSKTLGKIFDVLGQVNNPIYAVRFNTKEEINEFGLEINDKVYFAPTSEFTSYVILSNVMTKGSDASWENDIEVNDQHKDYSDDEAEREARRARRKKPSDEQSNNRGRYQNIRPQHRSGQRPYYNQQQNWNYNGPSQTNYSAMPSQYPGYSQFNPYFNFPPPPPPPPQ